MYLTIYVDDILIVCANKQYIGEMKAKFCSRCDISDMGELDHVLDIRVTRTRKHMHLDQTAYAVKVLNMFEAFLDPTQKTRKYPLPSNAVDLIAQEQGELSEEQQRWLEPYCICR